ncbi:GNAT family N-acetyltransferase [Gordonia jinhuaensis]|uniref:N-acetyltransferase domain-containing protein n=1 Tax=Gordonia jinhuaensis TaxID=1517702 RepID=A0A916WNF6_9ACTN|nr:GNAT family N-acetyltransferase [Gordonia jinhuaensis]GGB19180.1 hypothetical protein GCM10011489_04110 [Gordonia jinhuaensis]
MTIQIVDLPARDAQSWLRPALTVYVTAMRYPAGTEIHREPLWREHITRPGWRAVGALLYDDEPAARTRSSSSSPRLVGIAYGYRGAPNQWWHQQLRTGLRVSGYSRDHIERILDNYFELTELHVHPDVQGRGVGAALLARLLADRPEDRVLLSTPEVPGESNRAWRLYRRFGFLDVLRHFTFTGDPRPFAVLGRDLPLARPTDTPRP